MAEEKRVIRKIFMTNFNQQLMISIPKDCGLEKDDYVEIIKIPKIIRKQTVVV